MLTSNLEMINNIKTSDIDQLIKIHKSSFSNEHFTSFLPYKLLKEYLSKLIDVNEYNFATRNANNEIIGFIIAGTNSHKAVENFTKKNFLNVILILLKHPYFLYEKMVESMNKFLGKKFVSYEKVRLYLIEVDKNYQHSGTGRKLITSFENYLKSQNINSYGLSVRKQNYKAINFYEKNNFTREYIDSKSIFYIKKLTVSSNHQAAI